MRIYMRKCFDFFWLTATSRGACGINNIDGSTTYSDLTNSMTIWRRSCGRGMVLADDFLFSVDNTSSLAGNRESMCRRSA